MSDLTPKQKAAQVQRVLDGGAATHFRREGPVGANRFLNPDQHGQTGCYHKKGYWISHCGWGYVKRTTSDPELVTCKLCLRIGTTP